MQIQHPHTQWIFSLTYNKFCSGLFHFIQFFGNRKFKSCSVIQLHSQRIFQRIIVIVLFYISFQYFCRIVGFLSTQGKITAYAIGSATNRSDRLIMKALLHADVWSAKNKGDDKDCAKSKPECQCVPFFFHNQYLLQTVVKY